jgi:hypothetical protein
MYSFQGDGRNLLRQRFTRNQADPEPLGVGAALCFGKIEINAISYHFRISLKRMAVQPVARESFP